MRIIFFGSDPWFSPPVLGALLAAGHEILLVVSKGEVAAKLKVPCLAGRRESSKFKVVEAKTAEDITREKLETALDKIATPRRGGTRNDASSSTINHQPSSIILAAFGPPFLPAEVLRWPKYGCLNVHASLLPRWRGASPVFGAIANGDKETGVSIMRMTKEIDLGPVLGQANLEIRHDTREMLTKKLGILGGKLIVETLKNIENGQINEVKQPPKSPTLYTHRLTKDLGRIDWKKSPVEIERFIRAVTPWPGAFTSAKFKAQISKWQTIPELKILKAHLEPIQYSVFSIQYSLIIDLVQLPGKNPVSWKAFLAGHPGAKFI